MATFRDLPKVDQLADDEKLAGYSLPIRTHAARTVIAQTRDKLASGMYVDPGTCAERAVEIARDLVTMSPKTVINMSGVVLHTGLGRARLAEEALAAIQESSCGHAAVEFDLSSGLRGDRQDHVRDLLCLLTGAEDAFVVNNAASALVLSLRAIASDKEVMLSRGQMVEIGGSFRVPDIVKESGCRLVEVGCTNKTHLGDFAVSPATGAILVCHRSNFEIVGFTSEPTIEELSKLGIPVVDDMGTGCLADLSKFGLKRLKTLPDSLREGSAITIGSGDKLLGGPQAGLILGKRKFIGQIKRHPMARAVRVDKITLAALRATLILYAQQNEMRIPTLRYLAKAPLEVEKDALRLKEGIRTDCVTEPSTCEIGGGSGPGTEVPSFRVGMKVDRVDSLAAALRQGDPGLVGRIERGLLWLDPRTAENREVTMAIDLVNKCLS